MLIRGQRTALRQEVWWGTSKMSVNCCTCIKKTQLWRQYICDTIRSSELSRKKISFAVQGKNPNLGIFFTEEVEKQFHTAGERGGMNHKFFFNFRFSCSVLVWLDLSTKTTWLSLRKKTQFSHYPLASNLGTSTHGTHDTWDLGQFIFQNFPFSQSPQQEKNPLQMSFHCRTYGSCLRFSIGKTFQVTSHNVHFASS